MEAFLDGKAFLRMLIIIKSTNRKGSFILRRNANREIYKKLHNVTIISKCYDDVEIYIDLCYKQMRIN